MTALDQSQTAADVPPQAARPAAAPAALPVALPRDPQERLAALFDQGTLQVLPAEERSGVVAGTGLVHGLSVVAFASDARVQG
ncbi:MAG TPA: acyl-CoA carboxylase subunit beta, partial [Streptosporangiaceae bacterium]|nr:acyl-CoA carboxylase subunit beta [Streptosporangiaceae bacterium]